MFGWDMKYINIKVSGKVSGKLTPEENFSLFRVGLWVNVMVSFRVGGQPNSCPQEKCPLVRVRVCVRISFGIGGNFPRGQFSLSQYVDTMVFKVLCGDLSFKLHRWRKKPVFSFPKEEHVRKIKTKFVNRKDWKPTNSSYICIKHFEDKYCQKGEGNKRFQLIKTFKLVSTIYWSK